MDQCDIPKIIRALGINKTQWHDEISVRKIKFADDTFKHVSLHISLHMIEDNKKQFEKTN